MSNLIPGMIRHGFLVVTEIDDLLAFSRGESSYDRSVWIDASKVLKVAPSEYQGHAWSVIAFDTPNRYMNVTEAHELLLAWIARARREVQAPLYETEPNSGVFGPLKET